MEYSNWKVKMPYKDRTISIEGDNSLSVRIDDDRYTVVVCRKRMEALPARFYTLSADARAEGLSYRFLYIFYDEAGKELAKGYFMESRRVVSPVGTKEIDIEVLLTSERHSSFFLKNMCLNNEGAYQKRMAKVVALSSFVCSEPSANFHRTYREAVEDTLASVRLVCEKEHPDMIVLTENVFQTRNYPGTYYEHPNRFDGSDPDVNALCGLAKEYNSYIVCSMHEMSSEGIRANAGILIDRKGKIAGIYRKCQLTIGEIEAGLRPGDELFVFDTDFARIGIQICWDHYFPESTRALAMQGAELICVPTHGSHIERVITRARENGAYLAVAYTSREDTYITAPGSEPLLDTGKEKGYAVAEIDFNDPQRRHWLSCNSYGAPYEYYMCERREDLYGIINHRMI